MIDPLPIPPTPIPLLPIDPPAPPVHDPVEPPPTPPSTLPSNLTTDDLSTARNSLLEAQMWENVDPNRRLKVSCTNESDPLDPSTHVYYGSAGALAWLDGVVQYSNNSTPPSPMMVRLAYEDVTGQPVPPPPLPAPKALPAGLQSVNTANAAVLQSFAFNLQVWADGPPKGYATGLCSMSPPQPGFANTFSAPNVTSIISWIASVSQYIADGLPVNAAISVTSVSQGSDVFND